MVVVCSGGTTDDVPRSVGSATCSEISAGASCCWGACRGGEGTPFVRAFGEEGMILHGLVILAEEEKMVLSSGALVATWCFWGLFS